MCIRDRLQSVLTKLLQKQIGAVFFAPQCISVFNVLFMSVCSAELYLNSNKFDSAYACIQEAANYNPVSHVVSYMVCVNMMINVSYMVCVNMMINVSRFHFC